MKRIPGRASVQPFLAVIATQARSIDSALPSGVQRAPAKPGLAISSLVSALPALAVPTGASPWSPQPTPAAPAPSPAAPINTVDVAAIRAQAEDQGRADGLRETEELRRRLAALVAGFEAEQASLASPAAEAIADAATTVIAAWTAGTDRRALFAPIIQAWVARCQGEATAHVHPADVDAVRAELGEAKVKLVANPALARGDIQIRGAALEVSHSWDTRLAELREAIAGSLEEGK